MLYLYKAYILQILYLLEAAQVNTEIINSTLCNIELVRATPITVSVRSCTLWP